MVLSRVVVVVEKVCKWLKIPKLRELLMCDLLGGKWYKFCKVEVAKSRKCEFLSKKSKKNALFPLIIWWFRDFFVPLHAFSRGAYAQAFVKECEIENKQVKLT